MRYLGVDICRVVPEMRAIECGYAPALELGAALEQAWGIKESRQTPGTEGMTRHEKRNLSQKFMDEKRS